MEKINVIDSLKRKYTIPCFQREYSWEEPEIYELIKNIKNIKDDYCLGIITVQNKKDSSLLIDGQQRLTTLYLIAISCNLITKKAEILLNSEYESLVSNSNHLVSLLLKKYHNIPNNLLDAYKIINKIIDKDQEVIKNQLRKIYYYELAIDNNINLNHYFEVMNSRGIQLSRSDIIKSYLMNRLDNDEDKYRLNHLWYRYEKMENHTKSFQSFKEIPKKMNSHYKSINQILNNYKHKSTSFKNVENNNLETDNSILNFDYFLLYVVRLFKDKDNNDFNISGEFNLNTLINEYENTFIDKQSSEIIEFLDFMISIKNIYDLYIVKYNNETESFSLGINNNKMLLIQSCLRVSFVNRSLMHWLYLTLKYFYKHHDLSQYNEMIRNYIRDKYIKVYLNEYLKENYQSGFRTPTIVLNYLDLLIKENYPTITNKIPYLKGINPNEFKFKFRNSLEHFKSRHNKDGQENPSWVDDFGNLALLAHGTNSKIQNADPDEKATHFNKELSKYSLKLQIMSQIASNTQWNESAIYNLKNIMIELLQNDLLN